MATHVRYDGPSEQTNHDVAAATGGSAILEPGTVYAVPAEFADRLVESSAHWQRVHDYAKLSRDELAQLAAERGLPTSGTKQALVEALRGAETSSSSSTADDTNGGTGADPGASGGDSGSESEEAATA